MKSSCVLTLLLISVLAFCSEANSIYLTNNTLKRYADADNPAFWTENGMWGTILEEWTLSNHREKRILKFTAPHQNEYLMVERSDQVNDGVVDKEGKITPGKIVNTPPSTTTAMYNNYNKKPPGRQVTETDLYLLGAIEKLVYRVDFMEKRLRRVEEMLYYAMAGNRIDHEPCANNFSRVGTNCYLFSTQAGREIDWKAASKYCQKQGAHLIEMETLEENQEIVTYIQSNSNLRATLNVPTVNQNADQSKACFAHFQLIRKEFWTSGLNPGLLWIWSTSARPISTTKPQNGQKNPGANIVGDGRCLRMAYDPALRSYSYKGSDCSTRYSFICEKPETTSSNEVKRIGKEKNIFDD